MNVLVLGGTQEAQYIARKLGERGIKVLYSIAGLAGQPTLDCDVRSGGFGGAEGLSQHLAVNNIQFLIDATHPYAEKISRNAVIAAHQMSIPLFRYTRPPWQPHEDDDWKFVTDDWPAITMATVRYRRPFFTIGRKPLLHMHDVPPKQSWLIRTLAASDASNSKARVLRSRGPFVQDSERSLMLLNGIDVLVSKNSGGEMVASKIHAARELCIPIVMIKRPKLAPVKHDYSSPDKLIEAVPQPQTQTQVRAQA
ncbi:MAG: precorrin-6A/cobalt-precorrin-6A reductase [Pseudomonadota bacterium]